MENTKHIMCYDNGGQSFDRYTVVFTQKISGSYFYLSMSSNPTHPIGFGHCDQSHSRIDCPTSENLGENIEFEKLPTDCQTWVNTIHNELGIVYALLKNSVAI